jgi:hypothetical protein
MIDEETKYFEYCRAVSTVHSLADLIAGDGTITKDIIDEAIYKIKSLDIFNFDYIGNDVKTELYRRRCIKA